MSDHVNPLEKTIERNVCDYARGSHMLVYKFSSPGRVSVPDRMFITPRGTVFFIEFKRKGAKPTDKQWREIRRLAEYDVLVYVIDNIPEGRSVIDEMRHR